MKTILELFKDNENAFSSMRLKSFFSMLQFITLVVLIIINAKFIPGYPVLVAWATAAFAPKTIQSFIEDAYDIKADVGEDVSVGFFTDALGKLSLTRIMGFICLILAIAYTDVLVFALRVVDINILLLLLTGAFAPGLIQKIAEKNLKFNKDDFANTSKEIVNVVDKYIAAAIPSIADKVVTKIGENVLNPVKDSLIKGELPINIDNVIPKFTPGASVSVPVVPSELPVAPVVEATKIVNETVENIIPDDLPWSIGTTPGTSKVDEAHDILNLIK